MSLLTICLSIAAVLGTALIGGLFFAFSNVVMPALTRVSAANGIVTMQLVNVEVLNRWFLGAFMGTAFVSTWLTVIAVVNWEQASSPWLLGGAVAYLLGTWLVTITGNVPLNKQLEVVNADNPESVQTWQHYLDRWTRLNSQRALGALLSALLFGIGLIV